MTTMGKVHYITRSYTKPASREPLPLARVLTWSGVSLLMLAGMMMVLITLGEIARRLTVLSGRELSAVSEGR